MKNISGMYIIDGIEPDLNPRRLVTEKIPEVKSGIKMYEQDSGFICGLLKKFRPRKILEVGVSHGGTTAVILQAMNALQMPFSMYSVEIKEFIGRKSNKTGRLGEKACKDLGCKDYHLFRGVYLPQVMDEIGGDIDFVVLDTTHVMPGEILDFLVVFPFLSPEAVVCLHDIRQNQGKHPNPEKIATNVLFNAVVARKYVNRDATRTPDYPNIGAFVINSETLKYINNVFGALTQNWTFAGKGFQYYYDFIIQRYPSRSVWLFEEAVKMNSRSLNAFHIHLLRKLKSLLHA